MQRKHGLDDAIYFDDLNEDTLINGGSFYLDEQEIITFAKTWDPQPFHADPAKAKQSLYGGITAPSAYLFAVASKLFTDLGNFSGVGALKHQFEIHSPGYAGDTLRLKLTCVDRRVSSSKPDRGIVTLRIELTSEKSGKPVVEMLSTIMLFLRDTQTN